MHFSYFKHPYPQLTPPHNLWYLLQQLQESITIFLTFSVFKCLIFQERTVIKRAVVSQRLT